MKLALDTNVLIYAIERGSEHSKVAEQLLGQLGSGVDGVVSGLLFAELLSNPKLSDEAADDLYATAQQFSFTVVPVDANVLLLTAKLRRHNPGLKTPDAIHLATAMGQKVDYFVTNDQWLLKCLVTGIKTIDIAAAVRLFE